MASSSSASLGDERPRLQGLEVAPRYVCCIQWRSSSLQAGSGAPLTYQFDPLSATNIPYFFSAVRTIFACGVAALMSTLALSLMRRPMGGRLGSVSFDARWLAGAT